MCYRVIPCITGLKKFIADVEYHKDKFYKVSLNIKDTNLIADCDCGKKCCCHIYATLLQAEKDQELLAACQKNISTKILTKNELLSQKEQEKNRLTNKKPKQLIYEKPTIKNNKQQIIAELQKTIHSQPSNLLPSFSPPEKIQTTFVNPNNITILYVINIDETNAGENIILELYWKSTIQKTPPHKYICSFSTTCPIPSDSFIFSTIRNLPQPSTASKIYPSGKDKNSYIISNNIAPNFLKLLAETKRLYWHQNNNSSKFHPLKWNKKKWKFHLQISHEQDNQYLMEGIIHSNNNKLSLNELLAFNTKNILITKNNIATFEQQLSTETLLQLQQQNPAPLSLWGAKKIIEKIITESNMPLTSLPKQLQYTKQQLQPKAQLVIKTAEYKYKGREQLHAQLNFIYDDIYIDEDSQQQRVINHSNKKYYTRDKDAEQQLKQKLHELNFRYVENDYYEEIGWKLQPKKLDKVVYQLINDDWQIIAEGKQFRKPKTISASIKSGIDWFDLKGDVNFEGQTIPIPKLLKKLKEHTKYILLDDGTFGILPIEWLNKFTMLTEIGLSSEECIRFKTSQATIIEALLQEQLQLKTDKKFKDLRNKIKNFKGLTPQNAPKGFKGKLRDYQKLGLSWLYFLNKIKMGGCLADDMGLGKTVQVLALLEKRRQLKIDKPSLIVLPKSLIFNWQSEAKKFTPKLTIQLHIGTTRSRTLKTLKKQNIIITTYGTMRQDIVLLKDLPLDYCILDESQAIKNSNTATAKAAYLIQADHRLCMTGTPIENHLGELFSQFQFLNPGMLLKQQQFMKMCKEIKDQTQQNFTALNNAVQPFILRRTKEEVATDLPPKMEQVIYCSMDDEQKEYYDNLKNYYRKNLLEDTKTEKQNKEKTKKQNSKIELLEALLRLRQAACHPALVNPKYKHINSTKLNILIEQINELLQENHKLLIFSQFTKFLAIVKKELDNKNIKYSYLDGQTRNREQAVKLFQENEDVKAFLISIKAGGVGLNLVAADYVFILDPWWNPAVEAQAIDRAYRIGQTKHIFAYRMITKDTVEEKVMLMQQKKKKLADAIINPNSSFISSLQKEDLDILLS